MDTLKGRDSDDLREFCAKNNFEIVIILHNWANKFQPLDLNVIKAPKSIAFKKGIASSDVKVSLLLSVIKLMHAKWIVDLYHHLKTDKEIIVNGFKGVGISEAIENAQDITQKVNSSFLRLKQKSWKFFFRENVLRTFFHIIFSISVIMPK